MPIPMSTMERNIRMSMFTMLNIIAILINAATAIKSKAIISFFESHQGALALAVGQPGGPPNPASAGNTISGGVERLIESLHPAMHSGGIRPSAEVSYS
jgi:hypothetical protein